MSLITADQALKKTRTVSNKLFSYKALVDLVEDLIDRSIEFGDTVISMDLTGFSEKNINDLLRSLKKLGYKAYVYLNEEGIISYPELVVEWG